MSNARCRKPEVCGLMLDIELVMRDVMRRVDACAPPSPSTTPTLLLARVFVSDTAPHPSHCAASGRPANKQPSSSSK
eukprot:2315990-Rhodomonas_salina.2